MTCWPRTRPLLIFPFLFVLLALSSPAHGVFDPVDRISIAGQVGASRYAMGDVNKEIKRGNEFLADQGWTRLSELHNGFNFGWELRARLVGPLSLAIGGGQTKGQTGIDFDQVIEVRPRGNFYRLRASYMLPFRPIPSVRTSIAGGPLLFSSAEVEASHEHRQAEAGTQRLENATFEGKGSGLEGCIELEMIFNEKITMAADIGYRHASLDYDTWSWGISRVRNPDLDDDGDDVPNGRDFAQESYLRSAFLQFPDPNDDQVFSPNREVKLDFSGVQANVGLRFYLF